MSVDRLRSVVSVSAGGRSGVAYPACEALGEIVGIRALNSSACQKAS